ncbi:uncharacterized protein [Battus philenor]|uniref:uncharacterized protein n=1 Tax=Battus philenor TaxID=42288 RepID=UPI0035CF0CE6
MEKSLSEHEANQSFRSPPRRRRSTFFERRNSIAPAPVLENFEINYCNKVPDSNQNHYEHLQRYYDQLLSEKDQWKKEVNNRKNKYHDLKQQYQLAVKTTSKSKISYSSLSNEDIEFLNGKISISKLTDSLTKLHESIKKTHAVYKRASDLDDVILSNIEDKVQEITDNVLENSRIE